MNVEIKRVLCILVALLLSMFSVRAAAIGGCDGDSTPLISVFARAPAVAETGGGIGEFVFVSSEPASTNVSLQITGSATNGVDYTALLPSIAILDFQTETPLTLSPLADLVTEGSETVTVTITGVGNPCVAVGFPNSATIAIADGDALPPDFSATSMVVPIVAETASFSTDVYVRNSNLGSITLNGTFYEAAKSSAPGPHSCSAFSLPAKTTQLFTPSTQCAFGAGSHFGMLLLEDAALPKTHKFTVFSRSQTPAGVGFSVEGFPVASFGHGIVSADGLKRSAAGAKYVSNCFVAALDSAIDYQIDLFTEDGAAVGQITDSLLAHQMVRYLDVFALAGAAPGDYVNVRAQFSETAAGTAPFVAFCTMQESNTFSADFRIAKPVSAVPTPMIVPVVARTASYNTEVYVYNPNLDALSLDVDLYEADGSANPGPHACDPFAVPGHSTRLLTLGVQCTLDANSHFGMLLLHESDGDRDTFNVFSRSQTPAGVGFSVEGVPSTHFKTTPVAVDGLKRSSSGPTYTSNCFLAAPAAGLDYRIDLATGDGVPIGSKIGSLASHEMVRYLDVLTAANAAPGDYTNVTAKITETGPGTSPFVGFCTMQESVTFGADFRVAK